jgi:hypothetical protein
MRDDFSAEPKKDRRDWISSASWNMCKLCQFADAYNRAITLRGIQKYDVANNTLISVTCLSSGCKRAKTVIRAAQDRNARELFIQLSELR